MMVLPARRVAALTGLALATLGSSWAGPNCPTGVGAPPVPLPAPVQVIVYDADPQHLWNRLHRALWVRTGPDGKAYGHDRLDPLLWAETKYLLEGKAHEQAVAALDEFLARHGEKLVNDPLRRAVLQRDLWAVFDWTAEPGENSHEAQLRRPPPPRRALQVRLARCIRRLALTAEQAKQLPDNYAAAVASRAFAERHDPDHPGRPFLPPDLFQKDGPWVEIQTDNASRVTVSRHVEDFGARSAFRVFLRFPEGRAPTVAYFAKLRDFPQPWVYPRAEDRKLETLVLNPELPQFPAGTQAALVRQMLLVDDEGRIATTRVTESVQLRVFRTVPELVPEGARPRDATAGQDFYEFTRGRGRLFAGKTGGLRPLGPDDKDFHTQLLALPHDEFESSGHNIDFERASMRPTTQSCLGCHDRPGVFAFRIYTGGVFPHGRFHLPDLEANHDADTEGELTAMRKREQYSWGLLQGLWDDRPKK
jgi:hypothetical protein